MWEKCNGGWQLWDVTIKKGKWNFKWNFLKNYSILFKDINTDTGSIWDCSYEYSSFNRILLSFHYWIGVGFCYIVTWEFRNSVTWQYYVGCLVDWMISYPERCKKQLWLSNCRILPYTFHHASKIRLHVSSPIKFYSLTGRKVEATRIEYWRHKSVLHKYRVYWILIS